MSVSDISNSSVFGIAGVAAVVGKIGHAELVNSMAFQSDQRTNILRSLHAYEFSCVPIWEDLGRQSCVRFERVRMILRPNSQRGEFKGCMDDAFQRLVRDM